MVFRIEPPDPMRLGNRDITSVEWRNLDRIVEAEFRFSGEAKFGWPLCKPFDLKIDLQ